MLSGASVRRVLMKHAPSLDETVIGYLAEAVAGEESSEAAREVLAELLESYSIEAQPVLSELGLAEQAGKKTQPKALKPPSRGGRGPAEEPAAPGGEKANGGEKLPTRESFVAGAISDQVHPGLNFGCIVGEGLPAAAELTAEKDSLGDKDEQSGHHPRLKHREKRKPAPAKSNAKGKDHAEVPTMDLVEVAALESRFDKDVDDASAQYGVDVQGVTVSVAGRTLLQDSHLQLLPGERYGFIGANGAGKSTLLRCMAGKRIPGYPPTSVTVLVEQEDVGDERSAVDTVLSANQELQTLREEETALASGLAPGGSASVAVLEVELRRARAQTRRMALHAAKLSRLRGKQADRELLAQEGKEAEAARRLEQAQQGAASAEGDAAAAGACAEMLAEVRQQLHALGEEAMTAKARKILLGLGFTEDMLAMPTTRLSGGWRMRVALAKALFTEPHVLLLDEPTNHLDWGGILWLEKYLQTLEGLVLVVVSHDRAFLDTVATRILRLQELKLKVYEGNYSEYEKNLEDWKLKNERMVERMNDKRQKVEEQVRRLEREGKKSNNTNMLAQAMSRKKKMGVGHDKTSQLASAFGGNRIGLEANSTGGRFKLNAMKTCGDASQIVDAGTIESAPQAVNWNLKCAEPLGYHGAVLQCQQLTVGFSAKTPLVKRFDLNVDIGRRIAILGTNGTGKSTLLSTMAKRLEPLQGEVFHHARLRLAYFAQHQVDALPLDATPVAYLQHLFPEAQEHEVRSHLGSFGVKKEAVHPISTLSGGEKTRCSLAAITLRPPHILLLDEPTNHLDLLTVEALSRALKAFEGGIVLVSHDRHLIRELGADVYTVQDCCLRRSEGGFEAFLSRALRAHR